MAKPTRFAKRHADLDPTRTERNGGRRPGKDAVAPPEHPAHVEGFSHPVSFYRATVVLPKDNPLYRFAAARAGRINELSVYIEASVDGPAYVRVKNVAEKIVIDEKKLVAGAWVTLPSFQVFQSERLDLVIANEPYSWPENATEEERKAGTGSTNLMISGVYVTFMYFAEGGNRGAGQELVRLPARGASERR